ncbi:MAG TPA: hypothetical protein VNO43_14055, partial [Candidatus Eisenbacteria bacterium]|nr:hypothetical protein [Candidatus Eisenbacteria bacterium]
ARLPQRVRGEVTLMIAGAAPSEPPAEAVLKSEIRKLKSQGLRVKEIAALLGDRYACSKKEIYRLALRI